MVLLVLLYGRNTSSEAGLDKSKLTPFEDELNSIKNGQDHMLKSHNIDKIRFVLIKMQK